MDYYQRIQQSIEYMESNLDLELNISEIASKANFSPFYFQRLFQSITGFTVYEYLRKRRLTESAYLLDRTDHGIMDIAMSFGYSSQESYTRAFKSQYGISPAKFRKQKEKHKHLNKIDFLDYQKILKGDVYMNIPEIVQKEKIHIVGYEYKTSLSGERYFSETAGFYEDFGQNMFFNKVPDRAAPAFAYGVPFNYTDNGGFSFVVGEATNIDETANLEEGFIHIILPEGKYAEFKVKGSIEMAQNTWRYIYGTWLPNSNYERADGPDYEVTDVCNSVNELNMKIYIPLK